MTDPTPQAERVIEVAPQGVIQHWATSSIGGRGRGRYNCACGFGRASGISYEAFQRHYIIELESALTTMREERDRHKEALEARLLQAETGFESEARRAEELEEERDRAQDALRAIRLRVNRQFAVKTIDEYFALKPVSNRQPEEGETK